MAQTPQTRLSLIGRLHDPADSNAWHEFVQIYQPLIHRMVSRRGLQHADAAEVTQDVLGRVAAVIESWDPDPDKGSFRGWLYRMTRNLTIDFLRKNKLHQHHKASNTSFELGQIAEPTPEESAEFQREFERQLFHWAVGQIQSQFNSENWRAFWVTTVEGSSIDAAAEKLKIPKGKIYVARSRVMAKLSSIIKRRLEETSDQGAV